jgi:hypothetical protein
MPPPFPGLGRGHRPLSSGKYLKIIEEKYRKFERENIKMKDKEKMKV